MKKLPLLLILFIISASAKEGMWLPQLLKGLNETEMRSMGMEISADDIYSIDHSSLKDAVLQFGGGCTGELISSKGLLITNHHCGFSQIQSLSTIEKNYLKDGYWAKSFAEELPCPGLTVTFIRSITEVTSTVLNEISDTMNEESRTALVKIRTDSIEKSITGKLKGVVRQFYQGNKYYLFVTEVFTDIRFVGAPPQEVGKFGGETDNWMWPRHTGDFSLFRIYAGKDNLPAAYSAENVPYTPKKFLTINISGVKENDFVLVFGFPGRTFEYIFSSALDVIADQTDPDRIGCREARLAVLRKAMHENDTVRLKYSAKFSTLENAYKKWEGELSGFRRFNVQEKKRNEEKDFISKLRSNPSLQKDSSLFNEFDKVNALAKPLNMVLDYYAEAFTGIELMNAATRLKSLISLCRDDQKDEKVIQDELKKVKNDLRGFYKNYDVSVDKKICNEVLNLTFSKVDRDFLPKAIADAGRVSYDMGNYTDELFKKSIVADSSHIMKFLDSFGRKDTVKIMNDPAFILAGQISEMQKKVLSDLSDLNTKMTPLQRRYMSDLLLFDKKGKLFPDANSTLRISYGKVEGMDPHDGMRFNYFTTTDGILEKSESGEDDYKLSPAIKELFRKKDFGRYGSNGNLPVAFTASAHTTGGNSGSPALNAKGELIGVNYDRVWEGVLSDYYYDETYCRNICLDIRYALFIIEKYGNAMNLIDEMNIVK